MKNLTIAVSCLLILNLSCLVQGEDVQRVFTLENSISTALDNSQELLSLKEQLLSSKQVVNEAKGQILPKIDLNLSASTFDNKIPTVLPVSFSSIYLPEGKIDTYYMTRFSMWQYLYAGGRYTTNLKFAEMKYSEAQSQYDAMKNNVENEVKKAYYSCILAKSKMNLFQEALRADAGSKNDFKLRSSLDLAKHDYNKSLLNFLNSIGLELDTIIEVKGELFIPTDEYDLEKCLAWAYQYRPELRQTQFQETMDSLKVSLSLMERFPTITMGANYDLVGDNFSMEQKSWNATINMNLPVFDGWTSRARVKQRKNQARQGKLRRAKIEDRIRFEVRTALMDYNFWKNNVALNLAQSGTTVDIEKKIERLNAIYTLMISQANLDWAIGKSLK